MTEWEPKILAFLCNWCSYAGADLAGVSRIQYPPNVRIIRVMCSGRINPAFVIRAFQMGADGVLVGGCHPGDCHYLEGNLYARRRLSILHELLDYMGIEKDRFLLRWVSASEGARFAEVIKEITEKVRALGPMEVKWNEPMTIEERLG
jgi:coenzyme F420-reducing hydrogenase delta subunit